MYKKYLWFVFLLSCTASVLADSPSVGTWNFPSEVKVLDQVGNCIGNRRLGGVLWAGLSLEPLKASTAFPGCFTSNFMSKSPTASLRIDNASAGNGRCTINLSVAGDSTNATATYMSPSQVNITACSLQGASSVQYSLQCHAEACPVTGIQSCYIDANGNQVDVCKPLIIEAISGNCPQPGGDYPYTFTIDDTAIAAISESNRAVISNNSSPALLAKINKSVVEGKALLANLSCGLSVNTNACSGSVVLGAGIPQATAKIHCSNDMRLVNCSSGTPMFYSDSNCTKPLNAAKDYSIANDLVTFSPYWFGKAVYSGSDLTKKAYYGCNKVQVVPQGNAACIPQQSTVMAMDRSSCGLGTPTLYSDASCQNPISQEEQIVNDQAALSNQDLLGSGKVFTGGANYLCQENAIMSGQLTCAPQNVTLNLLCPDGKPMQNKKGSKLLPGVSISQAGGSYAITQSGQISIPGSFYNKSISLVTLGFVKDGYCNLPKPVAGMHFISAPFVATNNLTVQMFSE